MSAKRRFIQAVKHTARLVPAPVRRFAFRGEARFCPLCRSRLRRFLPFGSVVRAEALCPVCESLERHRILWLYAADRTDLLDGTPKKMLHFAPARSLVRHLKRVKNIDYLTADLNAAGVMAKMDVTAITAPDACFDIVWCNHVLEHVPDDRRAMSEIFRVLKPGGWAVVQVPIVGDVTDEDPAVTDPKERERRFGQFDHVRQYGRDYADRLREAGFDVSVVPYARELEPENVARYGLQLDEDIYIGRKAGDA